ncbi:MAG: glycosyltransferase family 2 protein [Acidimicrobiia bacterium]
MSSPADLGAPTLGPEPEEDPAAVDEPVEEVPVDGPDEDQAAYPPVLAVVVTRNPGPWLEDTLGSLAQQDYPSLATLVVDCASDEDPTARVTAALPSTTLQRLSADAGFAAAANEALAHAEETTFVLLCHDDVVLAPDVVRLLVEEAYRSNAGVVGPKLVSADDPELLLEVGRAIDRFGAAHTGIEPGEVDQEQHDGVRDVFYVSSATMLVRIDLLRELEGFDPATFPGSEDLDLCWRARLAGARVLVVPDARVAHREAADERLLGDRPDEFALARTRVRVLFTSYSLTTLVWLIPVGIGVGVVEAIGDLLIARPRRARAAIGAWMSNLVHFRSLRASRRRAQSLRHVHDHDLRELQVSSFTRLNAYLSHRLHGDELLRSFGSRSRSAVDSMSDGLRAPGALAFVGFVAMVIFGSRDLITHGVPSIGTMVSWSSVSTMLDAFGSAWRYTGLGSASAQPALQAVMAGIGTVLFGSVGLAHTLVVVVAMPLGAVGAYRLAQRVVGLRGPAFAAGMAYGVNPLARNAIAEGRLGPLVLFTLFPVLLGQVMGIVRLDGRDREQLPERLGAVPRGRILRFALVLAFTTAWFPLTPAYVFVATLAILVISPLTGGGGRALRAVGIAIAGTLGALVLLFPWPLAYVGAVDDPASLGFVFRPVLSVSQVMRFDTGPAGAGWAMWGLVVAAAVPLFLATGSRLAWAARGWSLALAGWALVWVPSRFAPNVSVPAPEAGLVLAAIGLALALGVGVSVLTDGIHSFRFGWRQPAAIIGGLAVLLPFAAFTAGAFGGRWDAPETDWMQSTLGFTSAQADRGEFRLLWVGNPEVLPLDPVVLDDGTGYTLTRNGPGDAAELLRAPKDDADSVVDDSILLAEDGLTNRLGRLLAPAGVRYLAMPSTQGSGGGVRAAPTPRLRAALDGQLDLARRPTSRGLVLYENLAWIPLRSVVTADAKRDVPIGSVAPISAALQTDVSAAVTPINGAAPVAPGLVLWGEAFNGSWEATSGGATLAHRRTFGWSNGYPLDSRGPVSITYTNQWLRWLLLGVSIVIWLFAAWRWWKTRVVRDRTADAAAHRERREREHRPDPLAEVLDDDSYWWERV